MDWAAIADNAPLAITAFFGVCGAFVGGVVKLAKVWRSARDEEMQSVRPVAPALPAPAQHVPTNPFGHPPPTDPALVALAGEAMQQARMTLDQLRRALDQAGRDQASIHKREQVANALKDRYLLELECERQKVASLSLAIAEHEARILRLETEKAELEARIPTPLRPPPIRR